MLVMFLIPTFNIVIVLYRLVSLNFTKDLLGHQLSDEFFLFLHLTQEEDANYACNWSMQLL